MSETHITRVKIIQNLESIDQSGWDDFDALTDEDVVAAAKNDADAQPAKADELHQFRRVVDVKEVRQKLAMTQEQFARTFHLSLPTLRDWEQNRTQPDQAARTLMQIIAYNPTFVQEALQ